MRLIDADALIKVIQQNDYMLTAKHNSMAPGMFTSGIRQAVDEAPTIDAVPVVRCRECVHYSVTPACVWNGVHYPEEYHCLKILERYNEDSYSNFDNAVAPEDFCSSGERKEPD